MDEPDTLVNSPAQQARARCRRRSPRGLVVALLLLAAGSGASVAGEAPRILLLTPVDAIPIRSADVLGASAPAELEAARERTLAALRGDLAEALRDRGLEVLEQDDAAAGAATPVALARAAREVDACAVVTTRLVAYGDIRRSWLWILGAQALAAGVGHGLVVAAATGSSSLGWWAGAGEFALESATWVGGAWLGSRGIDPVVVRVSLLSARDGARLGRWTREGTRPVRQWFRRRGQPVRDARLRAVADRVFEKLAHRLSARVMRLHQN